MANGRFFHTASSTLTLLYIFSLYSNKTAPEISIVFSPTTFNNKLCKTESNLQFTGNVVQVRMLVKARHEAERLEVSWTSFSSKLVPFFTIKNRKQSFLSSPVLNYPGYYMHIRRVQITFHHIMWDTCNTITI